MGAAFPEALAEWPGVIDVVVKLAVNSKDQHVIAAGLWGHADVVLTDDQNLQSELRSSGLIDAWGMPEFIGYTIDADREAALEALITMARDRWMHEPTATDEVVREWLTGTGLNQSRAVSDLPGECRRVLG
jgi:hypothetical protein